MTVYNEIMASPDPFTVENANRVLSEIPGLYLACGEMKAAMRRCKEESPSYKELDREKQRYSSAASELSSLVRLILKIVSEPERAHRVPA